jgi:rhomboid protease GluP
MTTGVFLSILSAGTIIACLWFQIFNDSNWQTSKTIHNQRYRKVGKSRYYELTNFSVANSFGGTYTDFRQSGKYNQYLNFDILLHLFLKTPRKEELMIFKILVWCKIKEQISNKISSEGEKSI